MRRLPLAPANVLLAAMASASLVACAGVSADSASTGYGGSNGGHCITATCLTPLAGNISWAMEITPVSSSNAAITQLPSVTLSNSIQGIVLTADAQSPVSATFTAPSGATVPTSANAVLTVPSLIPGLAPLTFQGPTTMASSNVTGVSLNLPASLVSMASPATLALVPLPPADQQNPPYTSSVALSANLQVSIASNNFTLTGALQMANATAPTTTFVARAFQGGALVSSAPLTQTSNSTPSSASFQLVLPSTVLGVSGSLTVELTPQGQSDPVFIANQIAPTGPLPTPFMLAPYTGLNLFGVQVEGGNGSVAGATVQAQTTLPPAPPPTVAYGVTQFSRTATTNNQGLATLALLPGGTSELSYAFVVIPPAGSDFATTCPAPVGLSSGIPTSSTAAPPTVEVVMLGDRSILTGTVRDSFGYGVANVAITATPGPDPTGSCSATPAQPASATTNADGSFTIPLDPGTYQLDYDPPAGSSAPRFTESGVTVAGSMLHNVPLPTAGVVEGKVLGPDGSTPLPSATVRFFEPNCSGTGCSGSNLPAPSLRAQTVTDDNGTFRVAVAVPPS